MTSTKFGRRQFIAGTGGMLAGAPYFIGTARVASSTTTPQVASASSMELAELPEQACDLTVRWRHAEPRINDASLVAAWPMDEGSGYECADISGGRHTLAITGSRWNTSNSGLTQSFRRFGRRGSGIFLDGTQWLQAERASTLDVDSAGITVSMWIRPDELPSGGATLASYGDAYAVTLTNDGRVQFTVGGGDGQNRAVESGREAVGSDSWAHVTVTASPTAGALAVYVDAQVVGEASVAPFRPAASTADLIVGRDLHGLVDEVTIHNAVISDAAIRDGHLVGLPKLYTQSRETIDPAKLDWTQFKGSEPIPHPAEADTTFAVRFDGDGRTTAGDAPVSGELELVPGHFGGAQRATTRAGLGYASPQQGAVGTFEAWYKIIADGTDPDRQNQKVLFRAEGTGAWLNVYTEDGRWNAAVGQGDSAAHVVKAPPQRFVSGLLEHVAVTWGAADGEESSLALYVNGREVGRTAVDLSTAFDQKLIIGGPAGATAYCEIDDVRVSGRVRGWGEICPRGHVATDAAGLDLRDSFHRDAKTIPMWWSPGTDDAEWTHKAKAWEDTTATGDAPYRRIALHQDVSHGSHPIFHPDAYGQASSIEAGVSFEAATDDGWAGVFVQAGGPGEPFAGHSFTINPARGELRLARHADGVIAESRALAHDFQIRAETTYELTLAAAGDGVLRGFIDGHNVISMQVGDGARSSGYAGLFTSNTAAYFDNVHFTALTPAEPESRLVQLREFTTAGEIGDTGVALTPFQWHKRRGLPPWQYTSQGGERPGDPELAGNIAGADTPEPERPIPPAFWRSEDSANSDLITIDQRVIYFMRGNPRVDEHSYGARIGVLDTSVGEFDGVHFDDPSRGISDLTECKLVQGRDDPLYPELQSRTPQLQVNNSGSAYVGNGKVLVFMNETRNAVEGYPNYRVLAYAYYDARANDWIHRRTQYVDWSTMAPDDPEAIFEGLSGTPELIARRDAETDEYQVILFHVSTDDAGIQAMTTTGLALDADGVPQLDRQLPSVRTISRSGADSNGRDRATKVIYNFRVLFDNGIYYLHYSEGPRVPDWPTHFPLCAALDPYQGPWIRNETTNDDAATYFRRGSQYEPDNAAIWQGAMFKHRGRYYMYYENFHAIDDIDAPYQHYDDPHTGSRVGYATAN